MNSHSHVKVAIVGAALSANKGAAAMVETVVARLPEVVGPCRFSLLTTYPSADAQRLPQSGDVQVVGLEPIRLAIVEFPIAVLAYVARKCRLPLGWVRTRGNRAFLDADVVVDVAGISFVDGRGIPITIYNALMTGVPLLLGRPTVKAAQALGPFQTQPNKALANLVLPHLSAICARGARTRQHLEYLHLSNVTDVADLAFSLEEAAQLPTEVSTQLASLSGDFIVVMPSSVVKSLYESAGESYVDSMVDLVRQLRQSLGMNVVIAPHSYRVGQPEGRMNDGPVCRDIASRCADDAGVVGIDADLTAGELRKLISMGHVLVTSRFHAMISGLATATPTVVVGWSHKYREVLDDFGLVEFGMDSAELKDPRVIVAKVRDALERKTEISAQIRENLPAVQARSMRNFAVISQAVAR